MHQQQNTLKIRNRSTVCISISIKFTDPLMKCENGHTIRNVSDNTDKQKSKRASRKIVKHWSPANV